MKTKERTIELTDKIRDEVGNHEGLLKFKDLIERYNKFIEKVPTYLDFFKSSIKNNSKVGGFCSKIGTIRFRFLALRQLITKTLETSSINGFNDLYLDPKMPIKKYMENRGFNEIDELEKELESLKNQNII